ncbi:MAG: LysM peptidoglycan-binding domain-containing protein, partial [Oscillospiraceae bacterium]|nr:LysM peptidoglycan-binding domain-containing protein [Oscillospiraceae bacterium]
TVLPEPRKIMTTSSKRDVYENNGLRFVYASKSDTYRRIARDFDIRPNQLAKYNEKTKKQSLKVGEMVYLEKKKTKGVVTHYFVQPGESLLDVAQKTGMTTKALCSKNRITPTSRLQPGTMLWLVKKKP